MPADSPSVLLIRLDAIGDALALTPLLCALGERGIAVDLVLRDVNAEIFAPRAYRQVFRAPFALRDQSRRNRAAVAEFGGRLASAAYTHILVATEDPSGYRLAHAVDAPVRIGFENGWGKPFKTRWIRSLLTEAIYRTAGLDSRGPHECDVLFALGRTLLPAGAKPTREVTHLRPLVLDDEPTAHGSVTLQLTDKWERLGIAAHEVISLAQALRERHANLRMIAPTSERETLTKLAQACGGEVEYCDSMAHWKRAIANARALVAPDSGAIHVAGILGTPVAAVFAASKDFSLQSARWAPWAAPHRLIEARPDWPRATVRAMEELTREV